MGYLCGSAVVKFKTYQMTNGRAILSSKRNTNDGKNAAEMFKWHLLMSKSKMSMETVTARRSGGPPRNSGLIRPPSEGSELWWGVLGRSPSLEFSKLGLGLGLELALYSFFYCKEQASPPKPPG